MLTFALDEMYNLAASLRSLMSYLFVILARLGNFPSGLFLWSYNYRKPQDQIKFIAALQR